MGRHDGTLQLLLELQLDGKTVNADYLMAGDDYLYFQYRVKEGDQVTKLDYSSSSAFQLNNAQLHVYVAHTHMHLRAHANAYAHVRAHTCACKLHGRYESYVREWVL